MPDKGFPEVAARVFSLNACVMILLAAACAQNAPPAQKPIERADQLKSKVTFSTYFLSDDRNFDLNIRHQFGNVVAWIGGFVDPKGDSLARFGAEYDYQHKWLSFTPTLELGSNGAVSGSLYAELGNKTYGIVGISRTNLRPFFDLFFDPSDAIQLGIGHHLSDYDRIFGFTIFDNRLHTHQQNTHLKWRHRLNAKNGITFETWIKTGRGDEEYVRTAGGGFYFDRPTWFLKAYYDPHVNFSNQTMVRVGIGKKF